MSAVIIITNIITKVAACRHACTLTVQARLHAYRTGRLYQSLMAAMLGAIGSPSAANVHASH